MRQLEQERTQAGEEEVEASHEMEVRLVETQQELEDIRRMRDMRIERLEEEKRELLDGREVLLAEHERKSAEMVAGTRLIVE